MTVLAFDYGTTKIGVAVGNTLIATASGLCTINSRNGVDWTAIDGLLREWQPEAVIVGLPLEEDGGEQKMTALARKFADALKQRQTAPVHLVDERFTSQSARGTLAAQRADGSRPRRLKKGDIDAEAAAILLRNWINQ